MDDFYSAAELRAIETAGRLCAASLKELRDRDEARREPYVPWTVSAGESPQYPNREGAT